MNDKIKELEAQLAQERSRISNCNHDEFGEAYSNPEIVTESYGYKMIAQGSDIWGEPEGYRQVQKPRWTRICKKCGYKQHTDKQEPIITGYKPSF